MNSEIEEMKNQLEINRARRFESMTKGLEFIESIEAKNRLKALAKNRASFCRISGKTLDKDGNCCCCLRIFGPPCYVHAVLLNVPYNRKEEAKDLGAKWQHKLKTWYISCDRRNAFIAHKLFNENISDIEYKEYKKYEELHEELCAELNRYIMKKLFRKTNITT